MTIPPLLRSFAWVGAITLALVAGCYGQTVKPNEVVKWDDYTFKFGPSAQMAQVLQGDKVVGSIIMMNGSLQVIPLPDADGESSGNPSKIGKRLTLGVTPSTGRQQAALASRHAQPIMHRTISTGPRESQ
jgi:hypothetical protein